ncbi:MAG: hypothetical protein HQK53_06155 [Oligoflexia bacterium]|nr:hypothetical protein [Oligoflexia bacterium]
MITKTILVTTYLFIFLSICSLAFFSLSAGVVRPAVEKEQQCVEMLFGAMDSWGMATKKESTKKFAEALETYRESKKLFFGAQEKCEKLIDFWPKDRFIVFKSSLEFIMSMRDLYEAKLTALLSKTSADKIITSSECKKALNEFLARRSSLPKEAVEGTLLDPDLKSLIAFILKHADSFTSEAKSVCNK